MRIQMSSGITFKAQAPAQEAPEGSKQKAPAQTILWNAGDILKNFKTEKVDGKDTFVVKDPTKRGPTYQEILREINKAK